MVPEETREWKPESAPQAMVMKTNGNIEPHEDRARAAGGEVGDRGHLQGRQGDDHAQGQEPDRADLHEGGEVVARGQQQPHGEHGGEEPVHDHPDDQCARFQREEVRPRRFGDPAARDDREEQQRDAYEGDLADLAGPQGAQVDAHEEGDRDGHADGEDTPRRVRERVHDDQREDREQDDHDDEDRDQGGDPADRAYLVARHLTERAAVAAGGEEQRHHVLDGAGEDDADDEPDRARQVSHLRGEHGTDQRTRPRDGGEVVAEQDPAVGGMEVDAVVQPFGGGRAVLVDLQNPVRDEPGVEAVRDGVRAEGRREHPGGGHLLTPREREGGPAEGATRATRLQTTMDLGDVPRFPGACGADGAGAGVSAMW